MQGFWNIVDTHAEFKVFLQHIFEVLPAEHKDGRAPLVEELERPVVDGGGVDLKEVFEDGEAGRGDTGQSGHISIFQSSPLRLLLVSVRHLLDTS